MLFSKVVRALLLLFLGLAVIPSSWAQTFTVLYSFTGGADGEFPATAPIQDSAGNLYGTTSYGTAPYAGSVFELTQRGEFTILHSFQIGGADGERPYAGLVQDAAGNLYGTTNEGGIYGRGTVFKLTKSGMFSVLHSFSGGPDGASSFAPLILDSAGNLYGTTAAGGVEGQGTVFKIDTSGNETVLYSFTSGSDGGGPTGGLLLDAKGNLYGTASFGGNWGCGYGGFDTCGVVFKLDKNGIETVFRAFDNVRGYYPNQGLIRDAAGNFYGTTTSGGITGATLGNPGACGYNGCGVVFKLNKKGKETVLHTFTAGADGAEPFLGSLILDSSGNLYGTTLSGGTRGCANYACGVVFKLDPSGNETILHTSAYGVSGGIAMDATGSLYGATYSGGDYDAGTIFKITP
jgi:uncharacterized repeat protein (TIGR03803 family)